MNLWTEMLGVGQEAGDLTVAQVAARAALIYVVTLAVVRLAKKRFLGRATAFDVVVGIKIGSIASRAITMLPAMTACGIIVLLHWMFSALAMRSHRFGRLIKGSSRHLVDDGRVDETGLRAVHMSVHDLEEALRQKGVRGPEEVAEARLERDVRSVS